jgi:UDP-3-O-[3-hydroxymyristoyl] glucosamine N-acyltransferase
MQLTASELSSRIGAELRGDGTVLLNRIAPIESAGPGDLSFIANKKYSKFLETTEASAVIAGKDAGSDSVTLLLHSNPYYAFMLAARIFSPPRAYEPGVHASANVSADAHVHETAHIGPGVTIEDGVSIGEGSAVLANCVVCAGSIVGDGCTIHPNVTIYDGTRIGNRVTIHGGTVIGCDGFGYATHNGIHHKIPQVGNVIIEDDVEIGANVTIDRATLGATQIGEGSKIDNLVQIAHNVVLGKGCIIVAQVGISGSTKLGSYVVAAGQAGIIGHLKIGDGAIIAAQSGVIRDIEPGNTVLGSPARDIIKSKKIEACLKRLPDALKDLSQIRKKMLETDEIS